MIDVAPLWDFAKPEASEQRFRAALSGAQGDDVLVLQTQIARLELLTARYPLTEGLRLLALLRDSLDAAIDHRDRLRRDSAGR